MKKFLLLISSIFFLLNTVLAASESSVILTVKPVLEDFYADAVPGNDPDIPEDSEIVRIIGYVNPLEFMVNNISNLILYDSNGNIIHLTVDKSSIYSEFDDSEINSMRISFIVDQKTLSAGSMRLVWGPQIKASNKMTEDFKIYQDSKGRYMRFDLEPLPKGDDSSTYAATLEVIVDDHADKYYLWYLLPIALIFGLLLIRRLTVK